MTIDFIVNNKEVILEAEPNERLIDILREKLKLTGAKSDCYSGQCGSCVVFFNDVITPACLVPAFNLHRSNVLTIEGFSETPEFTDITSGFASARVENCGYCNAGKIMIAESLLRSKQILDSHTITEAYDSTKCRCTDARSLVRGILIAAALRKRRRQNVK